MTSRTIAEELGGFRAGPRCDVVYPATMRPDEVDLLLKDQARFLKDEVAKAVRAPTIEFVQTYRLYQIFPAPGV